MVCGVISPLVYANADLGDEIRTVLPQKRVFLQISHQYRWLKRIENVPLPNLRVRMRPRY
jgi:hypothetical protein